jgi:2-isopropylmalate synthase
VWLPPGLSDRRRGEKKDPKAPHLGNEGGAFALWRLANVTELNMVDPNRVNANRVIVFDTTLRDGEQAPGFSMDPRGKRRLAHALAELGVDVIEAGFPSASPDDFAAVAGIAREVKGATIAGLARATRGDIEACARAVEHAQRGRIHTFISTSPLHRQHKLGMDKGQVLESAIAAVELARRYVDDVEFSAEDAIRTEPEFLIEVFSAVIAAGARTVNVPDTVGYSTPEEIRELFARLKREVVGADSVIFSAHCHNDLGLAVANSLAALEGGARQVECTINGIGERAGNAAIEELVMILRTRHERYGLHTGIDTKKLHPTSRLLQSITGQQVQRNKAIVGDNAFAHEAGIHQHGMLKHRQTYEIMHPEDVGITRSELVLGKHSGRHALKDRLVRMGYALDEAEVDRVFAAFKALADKKKEVYDSDLEALVLGVTGGHSSSWQLRSLSIQSATGETRMPTASVRLLSPEGQEICEAAVGDGPVDALFRALSRCIGADITIKSFHIRSISFGSDAQGQATVEAEYQGQEHTGRGTSTDILESSALAWLDVANRLIKAGARVKAQAVEEGV